MRKIVTALALASGLVACKGAQVRPTSLHELPGSEISNCLKRVQQMQSGVARDEAPIAMSLFLMVDADGAVPAAFIHDGKGADFATLNGCVTDAAVNSKFEAEKVDYLRPEPLYFRGLSGTKMQLKDQPVGPLDEKLAQATLTFAEWATPTDKAFAHSYVHDYAKAIDGFRAALQAKPDDARAMRGLAIALVDSKGDLKEAHDLAEKVQKAAPESEVSNETLLRVCLAQKDDKCTLESWEKARKAPEGEVRARSFELAALQDDVKKVADRYNEEESKQAKAGEEKSRAAAAKNADPSGCGSKPEGDERTLCFVKFCFEKGAHDYATSLKQVTGQAYAPGEWKVSKGKNDASDVTVPIRAGKASKKGAGPGAHDATWAVKMGDNVDLQPLTIDANNISAKYNACKK